MHRIRGKVFGVAVAIAATGLLAACGDDDSTASSTPTLTTTATSSAAAPSSAEGEPQSPAPEAPGSETEQPQPQQETDTAAPERPQPVPAEQLPEADTSGLGDKDKQYLTALEEKGVKPSSPDIALSIATYVCQGVSAGATEADLTTFVNAMAGSDAAFDPAKMPVEEAGRIYIETAKQTYCQ